jgi:Alpha-glutamyl/putrescinyl thymine pyrophosphorylase clade 2
MTRNYPRLATIEEFGAQLLTTGDLDPVYVALRKARLDQETLRRWLFAYWCCYHVGASCYLAQHEGKDYWDWMYLMAANSALTPLGGRWPRGHERRHFRGEKAWRAIDYYQHNWGTPENLVRKIEEHGPKFSNIRRHVIAALPQFGPWMAFKIGDMLERVLEVEVDFVDSDVLMFDQPYGSAMDVYAELEEQHLGAPQGDPVRLATAYLIKYFSGYEAPPSYNRPVNIQEVETILCKWKSHKNGSYPLMNDIHEIFHGLVEWESVSPIAKRLLDTKWY